MFACLVTLVNECFWISNGAIIYLEIEGPMLVRGKALQ